MRPAGILARHSCSSIPTVAHEPRAEMVLLGLSAPCLSLKSGNTVFGDIWVARWGSLIYDGAAEVEDELPCSLH